MLVCLLLNLMYFLTVYYMEVRLLIIFPNNLKYLNPVRHKTLTEIDLSAFIPDQACLLPLNSVCPLSVGVQKHFNFYAVVTVLGDKCKQSRGGCDEWLEAMTS